MSKSLLVLFSLFMLSATKGFGNENDDIIDTINCYKLFKIFYHETYHNDSIFNWNDDSLEVGQRNFIYFVKFNPFKPRFFFYHDKMEEDLNKVWRLLERNPKLSIKIKVYNEWVTSSCCEVLDWQNEIISDYLLNKGINENRFVVKIDRRETRMISRDNPIISQYRCLNGAPLYEINSWVDVIITDIDGG